MEKNNLPTEELKKFGIMNSDNEFSKKLTAEQIKDFKSGGSLIAEDKANSLTFKIVEGKLKVDIFNRDVINHKDLSSNELLEIATKEKNLYKVFSDYGVISAKGERFFNNNPNNEKTFFVEIANERGISVFEGKDLALKTKNFNVGDEIQIKNVGIEKTELKTSIEGKEETLNKFDNVFQVEKKTDANKSFQSKIFEYDNKSKSILDVDTTKYDLKAVNGTTLTKEHLDKLKKGKEVKLDDETVIQISPKSLNENKLSSNAKKLLIVSLAFDGGLSYLIVKGVEKLQRMEQEKQTQIQSSKYQVELQKLKGFLQDKAEQYPDNKKIINDLNVVGKELSSVQSRTSTNSKQEKTDDTVRLKVADRDMFEDANTKKVSDSINKEREEEETKSRGRGR